MTAPMKATRPGRRIWAGLGIAAVVILLALSSCIAFGMRHRDVEQARAFGDGVQRWQKNPDFCKVQREYVTLGVAAMQGKLCGISAERLIMQIRSLPGMPETFKVSASSAAHYRAFSDGELSAYLHLTGEQGIPTGVELIEKLGGKKKLSDKEIVAFLNGFKLPTPVATDAGAIASVRALLADVQKPAKPFTVRDDLVRRLQKAIGDDYNTLSPDAQHRRLSRLDDVLKTADVELWRTKQVGDFLGGIWAQGYGQYYAGGLDWLFRVRAVARAVAIVLFVGIVIAVRRMGRIDIADLVRTTATNA